MMPISLVYLVSAGLGWLTAQVVKTLIHRGKKGGKGLRMLYLSGNMPSAHTATWTSLTTVVGLHEGLGSGLFAITVVLTAMTAYDAMMVRRSAGEQGSALRKLLEKSPFAKDPLPYQALGHRPLEVAVGGLIGIAVGLIVAFLITI